MTDKKLLVASEVAEIMGSNWTRSMVHTYLKRGKLPKPVAYAGNQPLWNPEQIESYKRERGKR